MKFISVFGVSFMKNVSIVYNRLERLNTTRKPRLAMDATLRSRLLDHFAQDIEKLSGLIGRDLSMWLEG